MQRLTSSATRVLRTNPQLSPKPTGRAASTFHHDAHMATRTMYRWIASGLMVPFALAYALEKTIPHDKEGLKHVIDDELERRQAMLEQPVDDLHHTTGPLAESSLQDTIAVKLLNEQAKMWTCLWGMVGEAPCSFPVI